MQYKASNAHAAWHRLSLQCTYPKPISKCYVPFQSKHCASRDAPHGALVTVVYVLDEVQPQSYLNTLKHGRYMQLLVHCRCS